MVKTFGQLAVTFIMLLLCAKTASACSCSRPPSIEQEFSSMPSVFIGTVIKTTPAKLASPELPLAEGARWGWAIDKVVIVSFSIQEAFKGVKGTTLELITDGYSSSCFYGFEVGQSYLVYAYKRMSAGRIVAGEGVSRKFIRTVDNFNRGLPSLETNYCTRTTNTNLWNAEDEINVVRGLSRSRKFTGRRRS